MECTCWPRVATVSAVLLEYLCGAMVSPRRGLAAVIQAVAWSSVSHECDSDGRLSVLGRSPNTGPVWSRLVWQELNIIGELDSDQRSLDRHGGVSPYRAEVPQKPQKSQNRHDFCWSEP